MTQQSVEDDKLREIVKSLWFYYDDMELSAPPSLLADAADLLEELLASRSKLKAVEQGWQTIDSAPKDGTDVLVWSKAWQASEIEHRSILVAHFVGDGEGGGEWICSAFYLDDSSEPDTEPTHWRPLPSPPSPENSNG